MGFHTDSAICEVIDNSVEADAKNIQITIAFKDKEFMQRTRRIEKFVFVDDGYGMDEKTLFDCLVLGEGIKTNKRKGIGRFGVGATFAGISQGKFIGVYSKTKSSRWMYTQLDLELLKNQEGIPKPVEKIPPEEIHVFNDQGTVVIWDKLDTTTTEKELEEIKHNIGRIYRKFLTEKKLQDGKLVDNEPISILLNGEKIAPYDPMYLTFNPKADEKDLATIGASEEYDLKEGDVKGKMRITFSYLPESWWNDPKVYKPGQSPENKKLRKIESKNNGLSIVREGREMAFGEIPFLKLLQKNNLDGGSNFEPEDRFTGIEIEFNRDVDKIFGIEANKSRLFLPRYIREKIGKIIRDPIEARRSHFRRTRGDNEKSGNKNNKSKTIIQDTITPQVYTEKEKKALREYAEKMGQNVEEVYDDLLKGYTAIESWDLDPLGPFVRFEYYLGSIVVKYNMNHIFMKKFNETLKDIAERKGEDPAKALKVEEIQRTKTLFDLLLASYGLSQHTFDDPSEKKEISDVLKDMLKSWGTLAGKICNQDIKTK